MGGVAGEGSAGLCLLGRMRPLLEYSERERLLEYSERERGEPVGLLCNIWDTSRTYSIQRHPSFGGKVISQHISMEPTEPNVPVYTWRCVHTFLETAEVLAQFTADHDRCLSVYHPLHRLRHHLATALHCHYHLQEEEGVK